MSQRLCHTLVAIPYIYSLFLSLLTIIKVFILSFCGHDVIKHFYCDSLPLISLLCSDTCEIKWIILIFSIFNLVSSLLIVLVSYILILVAILRMNSAESRHKAFSTCGSHLTVTVIFYGILFLMNMQPQSSDSFDTYKMTSLFYTLLIPMLREGKGTPTPLLLPGKSYGRRSLVGCNPRGPWGSDTTEWFHFHFSLSWIGEGKGNPLQCSSLENPRDGGAW